MEIAVVKNAIGSLDELLSKAKQALWHVQREVFGISVNEGYAYPREVMKELLEELCDVLLVVLEAADMRETRASLINKWRVFIDDKGLGHTNDYQECHNCDSPALTFLEHLINFRLPTIFHPLATANSILIRRDRPLQMTVLPGGPSLALAR